MRVLVTAASKHGGTMEIAEAIGDALTMCGVDAVVVPVADARDVATFDAIVLGSAVYVGHWLPAAKEFVTQHVEELRHRPVWLFSSGPIGDPPMPADPPVDVAPMFDVTGAVEHRVFAGRLDRHRLGFAERAMVAALRAPTGDYRDWDDIRGWGRSIASVLGSAAAASGPPA